MSCAHDFFVNLNLFDWWIHGWLVGWFGFVCLFVCLFGWLVGWLVDEGNLDELFSLVGLLE